MDRTISAAQKLDTSALVVYKQQCQMQTHITTFLHILTLTARSALPHSPFLLSSSKLVVQIDEGESV